MKLLQRYSLVFVCVLLLSVAYSTIVSADETVLENTKIEITTTVNREGSLLNTPWSDRASLVIYPNNGTVEKNSSGEMNIDVGFRYTFNQSWKISNIDGNLLLRADKEAKVRLENGYYNIGYTLYKNGSEISSTYIIPKYNQALVEYYDGKFEYFELESNSRYGRPTTIYLNFTPTKDVKSIEFILGSSYISNNDSSIYATVWSHNGEQTSDNSFKVVIDTESVEAGLLSGIIGWIKNIYDTIVNLPSKIWEFISEGLKGLFVPSEEYLTKFKSDMDIMLAEKLGAIYQVVNILFEGWDRIQANDSSNTIDFPEVIIPLPNDTEFTFGGQSVQIVPEGFDFLATAIKTVTGICCTVLFVNGLKKRYDDIMGG